MIKLRESISRGHMNFDWLESYHSFSFGNYFDPCYMGFGDLRVINEDYIQPNKGFGTHPHKNMEIITFIIDGELQHRDTMNNSTIIKKGEIQVMSAGAGVEHSEFNPNKKDQTHLLQIWIHPRTLETTPRYDQMEVPFEKNKLTKLVSGDVEASEGLYINQDANIFYGYFSKDSKLPLEKERCYWLQLIKGEIKCDEHLVYPGDALAISYEEALNLEVQEASEFLLFDLQNKL